MKTFFIITALMFFASCILQQQLYNGLPKVDFCDLSAAEGKLVYTEAVYSGVDEYWALNAPRRCTTQINVDLDNYNSGEPIPSKFLHLFDSAYNSYWNTYLQLKLVGTYESKNPRGYGHLGSNRARFIVSEYVDVELLKRH